MYLYFFKSQKGLEVREIDPMDYGNLNHGNVAKEGLDRMSQHIKDREETRDKFSRRRMAIDTSVDFINDRNEVFNKKIKRAFDKYTVEIRQNLERGTAL